MDLVALKSVWVDVLDDVERSDRIAWLAFFDARLAKFSNGELTLDFSDATKFAEGHDIRATLPTERVAALEASIQRVTGLTVRVTMAS